LEYIKEKNSKAGWQKRVDKEKKRKKRRSEGEKQRKRGKRECEQRGRQSGN
jgi:hypothetical protein